MSETDPQAERAERAAERSEAESGGPGPSRVRHRSDPQAERAAERSEAESGGPGPSRGRHRSDPRRRGFLLVGVTYAIALLVGGLVASASEARGALVSAALADVAATLTVFVASFLARNSSFYDAYWSVAPPALCAWWIVHPDAAGLPVRVGLVSLLVAVWGVRLTWNWARGWRGLGHEDWRYVDIAAKTGRAYWLVSLLGLHGFPTVQVFLGCLSVHAALVVGSRPLGALDVLAAVVTGGAIAVETIADRQLRDFVLSRPPPGAILDTGLWARCRHPNYLGELGFWWGLWLFGLAAAPEQAAWTLAGPVAMSLMFAFVSIPLIDRRHCVRRPGYPEYMKKRRALIPSLR
jgi:steroid 5-alpha reductase family enzyme